VDNSWLRTPTGFYKRIKTTPLALKSNLTVPGKIVGTIIINTNTRFRGLNVSQAPIAKKNRQGTWLFIFHTQASLCVLLLQDLFT
jgi:hypothetical protein